MTGIFLYIITVGPPVPRNAAITLKRLTAQDGVHAEGGTWLNPSRADFVMRYIIDLKRIGEVMKNPEYSASEKVLLYIIADHCQYCYNTEKVCELSYSTIRKWTGWVDNTIHKIIVSLVDKGDITYQTKRLKGNRKSTAIVSSEYCKKCSTDTSKNAVLGTSKNAVLGTSKNAENNNNKNNNKQMEKKEKKVETAGTQPGKTAYDPNGFNEGELEIMRDLGFSTPDEWKKSFASCETKHTPKGYNPNEYNERELEFMRKGVI